MSVKQLKEFAEKVCEVLNDRDLNDITSLDSIVFAAEESGLTIATDKTRSNGGRPLFGLPDIRTEGMECVVCGAGSTCFNCRDTAHLKGGHL